MRESQAEVTTGLERPHLERPGQGKSLAEPLARQVSCLLRHRHLRLQPQRPRLMAALAALARLLQGLVCHPGCLVRAPGQQQYLTELGEPPGVSAHVTQSLSL